MSEAGPPEDTRRVYVTQGGNPCRHSQKQPAAPAGCAYICTLIRRTEATYCLVSANMPLFWTEYKPW